MGFRPRPLFVQDRQIKVTVKRERERARYGRGGHDQQVWRLALVAQRGPLHDSEPVLLVDHGQAQARHVRVLLQQRVRANRHVQRALRHHGLNLTLLPCRLAAQEQAQRHRTRQRRQLEGQDGEPPSVGAPSPVTSPRMVLKCCCASISVGAMNAPCRSFATADRRAASATTVLPLPNVSLQEAAHGPFRLHVGQDLVQ